MKNDVVTIVKTLIEVGVDYPEEDVCKGLKILKDTWPGLTDVEKKEIACVIAAYRKITIEEDEEELENNKDNKRTLSFEEEPRGFFGMFHK